MKILVFGAKGRLGQELVARLTLAGHTVEGAARDRCDLSNTGHISQMISLCSPDVVINASAQNGLEACSQHPFRALQINAAAPAAMAMICKQRGALMIHFSTDYVFSGDQMGLYEDTPTKPWGIYGRTKLWGEEATALCGDKYFVFRLSSLYGKDAAGVLQPLRQVLEQDCGRRPNKPVKVLHQFCAPTSTMLVADAICHVLKTTEKTDWDLRLSGLYHIAPSNDTSKLEFTRYLLPAAFGSTAWRVTIGTLPEPRPIYSVLKSNKFAETFGYKFPTWREDLNSVLPLLPLLAVDSKSSRAAE